MGVTGEEQQTTLLPPRVPAAVVDYLAGFATRYLYGEKPTAEQKRAGRAVGEAMAAELARIRP